MDFLTICILVIVFLLTITLLDDSIGKFCSKYPIWYYLICASFAVGIYLFQEFVKIESFLTIKLYIGLTAVFSYLFIPKSDGEYGSDFTFSIAKGVFGIFIDDIEHKPIIFILCKFIDTLSCFSLFYAVGMAFNWDLCLLFAELFVCVLFATIIKRK